MFKHEKLHGDGQCDCGSISFPTKRSGGRTLVILSKPASELGVLTELVRQQKLAKLFACDRAINAWRVS